MAATEDQVRGAGQIVKTCLGLKPSDELLVFIDDETVEVGGLVAGAAHALGVSSTLILVPINLQRLIPKDDDLGLLAQSAIKDASAVLNCVNDRADCLPFRKRLIQISWSAHTRVGHMPGASLAVLRLANVDFERLVAACHLLEIALDRGRVLTIVTHASDGTPHELTSGIGGWDRLAVPSDGVIADGVWGNVPSGETYIVPVEGTSNGSVVVNGSIPGMVLEPGNELTLRFEHGRVVSIEPADSPAALHLYETQIRWAEGEGNQYWVNLAEIGIGTNEAATELTGSMLCDEKAAGTAHIALGSSVFMGGFVKADIHCDLVMREPTILVDGREILGRGQLAICAQDMEDSYQAVVLSSGPMPRAVAITNSGITVAVSDDGRLQRVLQPEPGRVSHCFVGDLETSQLANKVYNCISGDNGFIRLEDLASMTALDADTVARVLHVLWSFGLIKVDRTVA